MKRIKKRLTDSCSIQYGYAFDSKFFTDDNNYSAIIRIRDVKNGYSNTYYSGEFDDSYLVNAGDILVGMDGEFNISKWKSNPALLNQRVCKIIAKDNVDKDYLLYYLSKELKTIEQRTSFVTVKHLSARELNALYLDMHSYEEQKQIASLLRDSEFIITKRKKQLTEYDQLIKSRFVEMFESFEKTDLSNIAEIIMGQSPDSAYYNENGVGLPFFQGKADFGAKYTNVSYWTTKPSKSAKKGNVLMSVRAPVGPVNISSVDCCIGRGLCSINAIPNKTNNEFLYNALIAIQDQITAMGTGSTFKAINKSDVYAIKLPLAPISLQNEFANFVEQVDKLKFVVQQSLDEMLKLFDSLMQKYFG